MTITRSIITITDIAPFIPSDKALITTSLPDNAIALSQASAKLAGQLSPITLATLEQHMWVINSYYSNLIEGNSTKPHDIRDAQRGNYNSDAVKRDLQLESLAHMQMQEWIQKQKPCVDTLFSPKFFLQIHEQFYQRIPEKLWVIKGDSENITDKVIPGQWRTRLVEVGTHIPPASDDIPALMASFCDTYNPNRFQGDRKLIAIMAAHHRFLWLHPFLDGNGRIGRLITDAALRTIGLDSVGVWCLSRGLAKTSTQYKQLLANADAPRQGDYDGRGALTEKGLICFCDYMMNTAIDQITYISKLLQLAALRKRINAYVQARNDSRINDYPESLKPVAATILYTAFIQGEIERGEALELCAMPDRTARRLLSQLKADGLLSETSSKSPLRWEIPEHAEAWYFPELAPTN
jgi:Fic family protein